MRHANMDEYSSVGPCAYSMCMMIELSSAQQAAYMRGGPGIAAGCRAVAAVALCGRRRF